MGPWMAFSFAAFLVLPSAIAAPRHENFDRAESRYEALYALAETQLAGATAAWIAAATFDADRAWNAASAGANASRILDRARAGGNAPNDGVLFPLATAASALGNASSGILRHWFALAADDAFPRHARALARHLDDAHRWLAVDAALGFDVAEARAALAAFEGIHEARMVRIMAEIAAARGSSAQDPGEGVTDIGARARGASWGSWTDAVIADLSRAERYDPLGAREAGGGPVLTGRNDALDPFRINWDPAIVGQDRTLPFGTAIPVHGHAGAALDPARGAAIVGVWLGDVLLGTMTPAADGRIDGVVHVPHSVDLLGNRSLVARLVDDHDTVLAESEALSVRVTRLPTVITLLPAKSRFSITEDVVLVARLEPGFRGAFVRLEGPAGNPVGRTDADGVVTFRIPPYVLPLGCSGVTARFDGSLRHAPASSGESVCLFTVAPVEAPAPRGPGQLVRALFDWEWADALTKALQGLARVLLFVLVPLAAFLIANRYLRVPVPFMPSRQRHHAPDPGAGGWGLAVDPHASEALRSLLRKAARFLAAARGRGGGPASATVREIARTVPSQSTPRDHDVVTGILESALYANRMPDALALVEFDGAVARITGRGE